MVAILSLPSIDLGENEARFYVTAVSDTWPEKEVSVVEYGSICINAKASRRFVNGNITGDLWGTKNSLSERETSFIGDATVGWITRYEVDQQVVTIIEVYPSADSALNINLEFRKESCNLVQVEEQSLEMYTSEEQPG